MLTPGYNDTAVSAGRRRQQTCNDSSAVGSSGDPAGANSWLFSTGSKRPAAGPGLRLGHFPLGI